MWVKITQKRLPIIFSCILLACIYYPQQTDYVQMRDYIIAGRDFVIRKHPQCVIIIVGDFNQLTDNFLKTHYRFVQMVNVATRGNAVLDQIWTNMNKVYLPPVTISEVGASDHNMVLSKPNHTFPRCEGSLKGVTVYGVWVITKKPHFTAPCLLFVGSHCSG